MISGCCSGETITYENTLICSECGKITNDSAINFYQGFNDEDSSVFPADFEFFKSQYYQSYIDIGSNRRGQLPVRFKNIYWNRVEHKQKILSSMFRLLDAVCSMKGFNSLICSEVKTMLHSIVFKSAIKSIKKRDKAIASCLYIKTRQHGMLFDHTDIASLFNLDIKEFQQNLILILDHVGFIELRPLNCLQYIKIYCTRLELDNVLITKFYNENYKLILNLSDVNPNVQAIYFIYLYNIRNKSTLVKNKLCKLLDVNISKLLRAIKIINIV